MLIDMISEGGWMKHFKNGDTDSASSPCCGQLRTAIT